MQVLPYINMDGRCEEAIAFYQKVFGAKVEMVMRFSDMPAGPDACPGGPVDKQKIMHSSLMIGETRVMMSDCNCEGKARMAGVSLSVNPASDAEAATLFAGLSEGGQVQMPLTKTFFASSFGTLTDKFGVAWMIVVEAPR